MVLFVNGCVREESRTLDLARTVLSREAGRIEEICLFRDGPDGLNSETLALREALTEGKQFEHPLLRRAVQFAQADVIVIAAPYWDLMFPARVRAYLEAVTVCGITFRYTPEGVPCGLCRAQKLVYVTTAGGPIMRNFGFEYIESLSRDFYGIQDVRLVKAEGLDIRGADPSAILEEAKRAFLAGNE